MYEKIKQIIEELHMEIIAKGNVRMLNLLFKLAHLIAEVFRERHDDKDR